MKHIIILGAGFGGLRTALQLSKKIQYAGLGNEYKIILVDRHEYHTYTPLLYEIATISKETADYTKLESLVAYNVSSILAGRNVLFIKDEVLNVDVMNGAVTLRSQQLTFEYLVLALGAEVNYFNIPGLKEHALPLKTFTDAILIRNAILDIASSGKKDIKIIIGGGGSMGVELAGEIKEWACELQEELKNSCTLSVSIIEGNPTILPGFEASIIEKVKSRLLSLHVSLLTGEMIVNVEKNVVTTKSGKTLPFDVCIWAGGVSPSQIVKGMPLKQEKRGRIEIENSMLCLPEGPDLKIARHIYAVGDIACMYDKDGKPTPLVARAAIEQGTVVAKNIFENIKKHTRRTNKSISYIYAPYAYPYIIPVGGKYAVARFGPFVISGFLGWILKGLVEIYYLASIMPLGRALRTWFEGFRIFIKNDRLG